jgi:hypothetical protein
MQSHSSTGKNLVKWIVLALICVIVAGVLISFRKGNTLALLPQLIASAQASATGADLGAFSHNGASPHTAGVVAQSKPAATNAPSAPSDLLATAVSDTEINLTWRRNSTNETAIIIQRSKDGETWNTVYKAPGGANIWTDTSLYPETPYHYRIAAWNSLGTSSYCDPSVAVTSASPANALLAPKNVTVKPESQTTATIAFEDTNSTQHAYDYFIERSDDGGLTYRVVGSSALGTPTSYLDKHLTPGSSYSYRVRCLNGALPPSPYSAPVQLTMPPRRPGYPIEPDDVRVVNDSGTTNTIKWTDTNKGAAGYAIERSGWVYSPTQLSFTTVGTAEPGATSFVDRSCSPETSYTYQIKAVNPRGSSDYEQVDVTTASAGVGVPKTYNIGSGETYPTIGSFNWRQLGPGDTVKIHANSGGAYHELLLLTVRGTAAAPITVEGVPDAKGNLPILDGANAVQNAQFAYNYNTFGAIGCITTYHAANASNTFRPGYLVIKNMELRNCYKGDNGSNSWTDYQGQSKTYGNVGGGIYMLTGDNITIEGCNIHGNGEGVFGAGSSSFDRYMVNIVLRGNYIWGNGNLNSYGEHNSYIECFYPLYEFNHYGPERAGAAGGSLKDRSVGTIIRFNYIESSARTIDLVEAQNEADAALRDPNYHYCYVYGNVIAQDDPRCANGIHYGGDSLPPGYYRKGLLYLWNNTIVSTISQHDTWRSMIVQLSTPGDSVDARNNIIAYKSLSGGNAPVLDLMPPDGVGYWGVNWVSAGWRSCFSANRFTGVAAGTENFITGDDPGFVSWTNRDYHLAAGSPCIGRASALSQALASYPLDEEYKSPALPSEPPQRLAQADPPPKAFHAILVDDAKPAASGPGLGIGASLVGKQVFPPDNPWNQHVDKLPVDPNSDALIASIGADSPLHPDFGANWQGKAFGIPYMVVSGDTKPLPVTFDYAGQSDPGPYPIPPNAPIEDPDDPGADHHILVIDRDHWKLYELFAASWTGSGWHAGSGAVFDLHSNALRPDGWTSADAAGLPIFPGLARYDEVVQAGVINHALRFTVRHTRRAYILPARHFASRDTDPNLPPMGMRVRLKASYDISGFPPQARVILQALKTYGMILADNGGNWFVSGAPDARWDDGDLHSLSQLHGSDFEVVKMGPMTTQ